MRTLLAFLLAIIYVTIVHAQVQSVIGFAGGSTQSDDILVEFTLGEPLILTLANNKNVVTQGFHQPDINLSTSIVHFNGIDLEITTYPNPFDESINVKIDGAEVPAGQLQVIDLEGRMVWEKAIVGGSQSITILGESLGANGMYFIRYINKIGQIINTDKILRIKK